MSTQPASRIFGLLALIVPLTCSVANAQNPAASRVPVHGFTGTLALPDSVDKFYSDVNKIIVETSDGISHIVDLSPETKVHKGTQSLDSLRAGTPVVVHYTVKGISASTDEIDGVGPDGLNVNEGIVTRVDRSRKEITLRLSSGTTRTLRLTHHAADDRHTLRRSRVIVSYADQSGRRLAHSFKPVD